MATVGHGSCLSDNMRTTLSLLLILGAATTASSAAAAPPAHALPAVARPTTAPPKVATPKPAASTTRRAPVLAAAPPRVGNSDVPAAVDLAKELAPLPGFAYPAEDIHALRAPARAIVDAFGRLRSYAEHRVGELGAGPAKRFDEALETPRTLEASLGESLAPHGHTAEDVPQLLRNEARRPGLAPLTKEMLKRTADLWENRSADPRWTTLTQLSRRRPPKPAAPANGDAAQQTRSERIAEMRAQNEWDVAPRARGWDPSYGYRELVGEPATHQRPAHIQAFSYKQWMAFRVAELLAAEEQAGYIEMNFGDGRHR